MSQGLFDEPKEGNIWEEARRRLEPNGHEIVVRLRTLSNGDRVYWEQCLICGAAPRRVSNRDPRVRLVKPDDVFDEDLSRDNPYRRETQRLFEEQVRRSQEEREHNRRDWWTQYSEYLNSAAWKAKRQKVLMRDGYTCQACGSREATQAHHLTYRHVFNEPLFDLVAICEECHNAITELDRTRRGAA